MNQSHNEADWQVESGWFGGSATADGARATEQPGIAEYTAPLIVKLPAGAASTVCAAAGCSIGDE